MKTYGPTGAWQCILAKRDDGNGRQKVEYQIALTPDIYLSACVCTGGPDAWWHPDSGIRIEPGRWYRVAATFDGFLGRAVIHVDGSVRAVLRGAPAVHPGPNPLRIGWSGWDAEHFYGEIRELRVVDGLAEAVARARAGGSRDPVSAPAASLIRPFTTSVLPLLMENLRSQDG